MRRYFLLQLLAPFCAALQKKGKSPKLPEVVILEVTCRRMDGDVQLDGSVRVQAEKPINRLKLLIDFLGTDKQLLSTKRGEVSEEVMKAGDEMDFHMRVSEPPRSVWFSLRAEAHDGRELRTEGAGPFAIQ